MSTASVVLVLSLLLGLQPVTTDLYLPAFPALTASFAAPMSQAQLTLSALMLAFGISQLVWGPLSDRFGRRPVLLVGLSAYTLASLAGAFAPSMLLLIVCRTVQGAAMGAAVMCARAIVRDLYTPVQGARAMSRGLTGLGVIACLCAPLGGLLTDAFNWRIALLVLPVFSACTLALIFTRFTETVKQPRLDALSPASLFATWWQIVRHPTFLAWCALATASYGALFTFLASSSFVLIQVVGLSRPQYGLAMFLVSFMYILGTFACRRLLPRVGIRRAVAIAGVLTFTAGMLMGVFALAGIHNVWSLMVPFCLFMVAHGVHQPCSQSGAVGPFPQAAGTASALAGFVSMAVAFLIGIWLGVRMDGTVMPLAEGVWFWSMCVAVIAWTLVRKHGEAQAS